MTSQAGKNIGDFRWENRLIVMNSEFLRIDSLTENYQREIKERKLVFFEFNQDQFIKSTAKDDIDPASFIKALSLANASDKWILVGLDGGIKASGAVTDFSMGEIFAVIDQMPMRKPEIKVKMGKNR